MKPQHVVHAADYGSRMAGSFIPLTAALARRLHAEGSRMTLIVPDIEGATWHESFRETGATLLVARSASEAARLVADSRPDIVHAHFFGWLTPATRAVWRSNARVFWHIHSTVLRRGSATRLARGIVRYRLVGGRAERFIAVSEGIAGELRSAGAPAAKIAVVTNAVDAAAFRPPHSHEREAARARYGITGDRRTVLFFCRDGYIKGADRLATALDGSAFRLLVIGAPKGIVERFAGTVETIALAPVADVRTLYWASDVLAMPSRGEGFGFTLVEALAAGIPAVTSDLPPFREIAGRVGGVTIVDADDRAALAAALSQANGDVHKNVPLHYGVERWVDETVALYGAR